MRYVKMLEQYEDERPSAVTFGKFDGLHMGHQALIETVRELGHEHHLISVICEFDMRPIWRHTGKKIELLMTGRERYHRVEGKVDYLLECPFTEDFRNMTALEFIKEVICNKFHAKYVVVGTDFRFGKNQGGDVELLRKYEEEYGYRLVVIEKKKYKDQVISSTYIRKLLKEGNVELTNYLLGYRFRVSGIVERGKQLGRTLGFPTMNIEWPEEKLIPPKGVYLTISHVDGETYHGISNIGVRPTVSDSEKVFMETFLFDDYHDDAYEKKITVELLQFRRAEKKFESVAEMKKMVDEDIAYAKEYFGIS